MRKNYYKSAVSVLRKAMAVWCGVLVLFLVGCGSATKMVVKSPDASIEVQLSVTEQGGLQYSVIKQGDVVLLPSKLGVTLSDLTGQNKPKQDFRQGLNVTSYTESTVHDRYTMIQGKQKSITYTANEAVYTVENSQGATFDIVFRVSNDGVAFQYSFPNPRNVLTQVSGEYTSFSFDETARAWLQPVAVAQTGWSNTNPSYEEHYQLNAPVGKESSSPAGWVFPALFKSGEHWLLVTEAGISSDFHASRLQATSTGGEYFIGGPMAAEVTSLKGKPGELLAQSDTAFRSPWRIVLVGGLETIIESTLGTDLAEPAISDMPFVKPGVASWSWALLKDASVNYETSKEFISYASDMGWPYTLIDADWDRNIGYERMQELSDFAAEKNVGLLVWYNSSGDWNTTEYTPKSALLTRSQRRAEFSKLQKMGIKGVKIDFFPGDGKSVIDYYHQLARDAADFELLVNYHGSSLPRGLQRTYPNMMTMESVHGFEMITFLQPSADKAAEHMAMLPFTRNAFDPMDFTPTTFFDIPNIERRTKNGFEIALPVLFLSGIQHIAETAEGMANVPDFVRQYMKDIPVAWDESKLLAGFPGEYVVVARRDGDRWFLAGINAKSEPLTVNLDLSFIGGTQGKIIQDSSSKKDVMLGINTLTASDHVEVNMDAFGGFVATFSVE